MDIPISQLPELDVAEQRNCHEEDKLRIKKNEARLCDVRIV
jgi:hypothetical protein